MAAPASSSVAATRLTVLCVALVMASGAALAQYKVIGPDGRVTYTDRPPADPANRVLNVRKGGGVAGDEGSPVNLAGLPQALRQPTARFPVTLITSPDCTPCDTARQALQRRGVPFTELGVSSAEDQAALQRLTGAVTVPSASIGSQVLRGWLESDWMSTLDLAGYPRESALPKGWRWAAARPLAPPKPAPEAAEARPAPAPPPAPPAPLEDSTAPGPKIRF